MLNKIHKHMECRICFNDQSEGRLVTPCLCKGTMCYIHITCLQTWRSQSVRAYAYCTQCLYPYESYCIKTMLVLHLLYFSFFIDVVQLGYIFFLFYTPIGVKVVIGYKMYSILIQLYNTYGMIQDMTHNII